MTGFARVSGASANIRWAWELKSVNAKGLDLRLRLPPGFDPIEAEARARSGAIADPRHLLCDFVGAARGRDAGGPSSTMLLRLLTDALIAVRLATRCGRPRSMGCSACAASSKSATGRRGGGIAPGRRRRSWSGLDEALAALVAMREGEGDALGQILQQRLTGSQACGRRPKPVPPASPRRCVPSSPKVAALAGPQQIRRDRLYQEALLLAAKADVREELDRLAAHVAAARRCWQGRPDRPAAGFPGAGAGREANTLCAKSNDASLTAIGLELRVEIEQFREQVQNIE